MNFSEEEKRNIKIALTIILVSVLISLGTFFIDNGKESEIEKIAKNLGKQYYEESLYKTFSKKGTSLLNLLKDDGYKVNLQTLVLDNSTYFSYFTSSKKCDLEKSYIIIYPKKPYKEANYKVKTYLDCE